MRSETCNETTRETKDFALIYCPYTDKEIREDQASREHIIPLSLGGVNGFEILVDAAFNSQVGSALDGAIANEFFFTLRRTEYDTRGHSGKKPTAIIKNASYGDEDRPAQAHFHRKDGLRVWDAKDREFKERLPSVQVSTSLNIDLPIRFTAKVALAAGYFTYGDLFRKHVDHLQLRDVMNTDPANLDLEKSPAELGLGHLTLKVDYYLREVSEESDPILFCLRSFCSELEGSVVVLMPGHDCFRVAVGILGLYVGMVNVSANTAEFPNQGDYRWGHLLAVTGKKLERCSWADGLKKWTGAPWETSA